MMAPGMCSLLILLCVLFNVNGQTEYPVWPSPYSWNGTFIMHEPVNIEGTLEMCYDFSNEKFSKSFHGTSNSSDIFTFKLLFLGKIEYNICYGPNPCFGIPVNTCTNSGHSSFPYPQNQFENYTNVGEEIVHNNRNVFHYVGLTPFGYDSDQYFFTQNKDNKYPGYPAGNIMIAEPGWTTEGTFAFHLLKTKFICNLTVCFF